MQLISKFIQTTKMCKRLSFTTLKLVYLLTLLCCYSTSSPINAEVYQKYLDSRIGIGNPAPSKPEKAEVATSAPAPSYSTSDEASAKVLNYNNDNDGLGSYKFAYDTENDIHQSGEGILKQIGDVAAVAAQGSYEYSGPNGEKISVAYVADENGYRPKVLITLLSAAPPPPSYPILTVPAPEPVPPAVLASLGG